MNRAFHRIGKTISYACAIILLCIPQLAYNQTNLDTYYNLLEESLEDPSKISKIAVWIDTIKDTSTTLELSDIYSDFSKFCYRKKEVSKAIAYANKALEVQFQLIDTLPSLVNRTYNNLSVFYKKSGQDDKAFSTLKNLVALPHKDKYSVIAYTNGLKDHAIQRGDYFQALTYLQEAEQIILQDKNKKLLPEYYRVAIAYAGVYMNIGGKDNLSKGIVALQKADSLNALVKNKKRQGQNHMIIHNRFGQIYSTLKSRDSAIHHFNKALEPHSKYTKTAFQQAAILNNLGVNYFKIGKPEIAFSSYQKALEQDPYYTAAYDNLGDYYLAKKQHETALSHYQKAIYYGLDIKKPQENHMLPKSTQLENSLYKTEVLNDLKDKAKAWFAYYKETNQLSHLKNALSTIEQADYLVDLIRQENIATQSKFFWRTKEVDLYMLATSIAFELNNPKKGFYFMEKSKALALLENLTHEEAKKRALLPDSLITKEYLLKKNILTTRKEATKDTSIPLSEKNHLINRSKKTYQDFINSLEQQYPNYYSYKKDIRIASFDEVHQNAVKTATSYIQYIISDHNGYGILITPKEYLFFEINNVNELHKEVLAFGNSIQNPWKTKDDRTSFMQTSQSLYQKLLPFDIELIKQSSTHLIIIPDYDIQHIPFEGLISSINKQRTPKYLIEDFNISYLYSNSLHQQVLQKERNPSKFLLGMAPVDFNTSGLPQLSLSETKLHTLQEEFDADIFLHHNANKANFDQYSKDYQIVHLSSHANSLGNETPWIAFSDQKLTLNELYFIPNQADIVILDACKTGMGKVVPGEGTLSLARGFFHSGAKSVISSMWNTNEKSSNEIILRFYELLKNGKSKSEALRQAKLNFIHTHQGSEKSPYYWGALVLTGDYESLAPYKSLKSSWTLLLASLLVLIILSLIIIARRKFN